MPVLHRHQHRAAPFATDAQPLHEAQGHEQHRGEHAGLLVGGQQADAERGHAHQHERRHEHGLAAQLVAEVPEDDAAQRPREEADRVGGKGRHRACQRVHVREEQLVEHQRRRRAVEEEVIPLDGGADETGQHHAAHRRGGRR